LTDSGKANAIVLLRRAMTPSQPSGRTLAGVALILLLIVFLAALVASLALWVARWPIVVQALFYLFMGIIWIIPLKPLVRWMVTGRFRPPAE
jgi:predicted membrane channel-forming protein YqfA (hemolysin III family)